MLPITDTWLLVHESTDGRGFQNLIFRFLQSVSDVINILLISLIHHRSVTFFFSVYIFAHVFANLSLFRYELRQKARIQIWLFEQKDLRIEGRIIVRVVSLFSISC